MSRQIPNWFKNWIFSLFHFTYTYMLSLQHIICFYFALASLLVGPAPMRLVVFGVGALFHPPPLRPRTTSPLPIISQRLIKIPKFHWCFPYLSLIRYTLYAEVWTCLWMFAIFSFISHLAMSERSKRTACIRRKTGKYCFPRFSYWFISYLK